MAFLKKCNQHNYTDEQLKVKVKQERKSLKMKGNIALHKMSLKREISAMRDENAELEILKEKGEWRVSGG